MAIDVFRIMQIVVLADEYLKNELMANGTSSEADIRWISSTDEFTEHNKADAFIDLLFENDKKRIALLSSLLPKPVLINSVSFTLRETHDRFIRINGWKTFLSSNLVEASAAAEQRNNGVKVLSVFNKTPEWLPDELGFITPRVISMIINEAFLAFSEGVSSKEDINTAMKLGTNYPYGPFEWAELIGEEHISMLLKKMTVTHSRYCPSPLLP